MVVQTRLGEHRVLDAARRGDPAQLNQALALQAKEMGWPPAVAQAEISGAGAPAFIDRLGRPIGLDVLGPNDDRWLLRSQSVDTLVSELAQIDRGDDRLRIAVH